MKSPIFFDLLLAAARIVFLPVKRFAADAALVPCISVGSLTAIFVAASMSACFAFGVAATRDDSKACGGGGHLSVTPRVCT